MIEYINEGLFYGKADKQLVLTSDEVTITNSDIYADSFELTQNISSGESIRFGAEAAQMKLRVLNNTPAIYGKMFDVSMNLNGEPLQIGKFVVEEDKPNGIKFYRDIVAYDMLYTINSTNFAEWYKNLTFPLTYEQFFQLFVDEVNSQFGLQIGIDKPIVTNKDFAFENSIAEVDMLETLSGGTILTALAEATASFIRLNNKGNFEFTQLDVDKGLYPSKTLYPSKNLFPRKDNSVKKFSDQYYISCSHEDYKTKKIDKVQIVKEDGDIGVFSGSDGNTFTISGNFLLGSDNENLQTACDNIFNAVKGITYTPCKLTAIGNPCIEVGDYIKFESHGVFYATYVFQRTLKGIQFLKDTYRAEGSQEIAETSNDLRNQVIVLNGKSNVLTTNLERTVSRLEDFEERTAAEFEQTSESISTTVSRVENVEGAVGTLGDNLSTFEQATTSRFEQTAESISTTVSKVENVEGAVETLEETVGTLGDNLSTFEQSTTSRFEQTATDISAKVSQEGGNTSQTFRWELKSDHASYYSGNGEDEVEVFRADETGITVTGITINNGKFKIETDDKDFDFLSLKYGNEGVAITPSIISIGEAGEGKPLASITKNGFYGNNLNVSNVTAIATQTATLNVGQYDASWKSGFIYSDLVAPQFTMIPTGSFPAYAYAFSSMPNFSQVYFLGR